MVMGLLLKLFMTGQIKTEGGTISLRDINLNILPASTMATITDYFFKKGEAWKLYAIMWLNGYMTIEKLKNEYHMNKADQIYSFGMDFGEAIGFGLYKTHDYHPGRYTHFKIKPNPFTEYYVFDNKPLDYFIAGTMAGGGSVVHKSVCQTVETHCALQTKDFCEFLTGTEKELKSRNLWKTAVERYNLKRLYPAQKRVFSNYGKETITDSIKNYINSIL